MVCIEAGTCHSAWGVRLSDWTVGIDFIDRRYIQEYRVFL